MTPPVHCVGQELEPVLGNEVAQQRPVGRPARQHAQPLARQVGNALDAGGARLIVGQDPEGHWVAIEIHGRAGGLFRSRKAAVDYEPLTKLPLRRRAQREASR